MGDLYLSGVTVAEARRRAFGEDVLGKLSFSFLTVAMSAACASLVSFVSDDPDGLLISVWTAGLEPEARSLGATRHSSLIRSMAASVV
jgi:hypothetical protein